MNGSDGAALVRLRHRRIVRNELGNRTARKKLAARHRNTGCYLPGSHRFGTQVRAVTRQRRHPLRAVIMWDLLVRLIGSLSSLEACHFRRRSVISSDPAPVEPAALNQCNSSPETIKRRVWLVLFQLGYVHDLMCSV